jgi:hypothetical protein
MCVCMVKGTIQDCLIGWLFFVVLGIEPRALILARQVFYHLSRAPSPFVLYFIFEVRSP